MISVGLDVGGTKILGVAMTGEGIVLREARRATVNDGAGLLEELCELYRALSSESASEQGAGGPAPLGVGLPGLVDPSGLLAFSPNLSAAGGIDVRGGLRRYLEDLAPVIQVDNDATCAAAGESSFGAGRGESEALFVTLGTGIGGGIVSGGRLLRGANNFSGEIGHFVVDPQGPPCGCGRRGCWERYASGSGLGRVARDYALAGRASRVVELAGGDPDVVRGEDVVRAIGEGDEEASAILGEFAWWVALGLANLAAVLDPRLIVIGGGLVRAGDALLGPVRGAFAAQLEGASLRPPIEIVGAALGDRGGAVGAATVALEAAGVELVAGR